MSTPTISLASEITRKFDPRTGDTGRWLGGDVAFSLPMGDGRYVWFFGDTHWAFPGDPNPRPDRVNAHFTNDSIAIQHGPDPATTNFTFHSHVSRTNFFEIPGGTHYAWVQSAMWIGDDLYVWSMRTQASDNAVNAGWAVHRIVNARNIDPVFWNPQFLYQSADSDIRPTHAPYDGSDGYIYAFALKIHTGWRWARWSKTSLVAGNAGTVQYATLSGWTSDPTQGYQFADSIIAGEGSFHRRSDGRWVQVESGVDFPHTKIQVRLSAVDGNGSYNPANAYLPMEPHFQVGDHVNSSVDFGLDGIITAAPSPTTREIVLNPAWDSAGTKRIRDVSTLTMRTRSERYLYDPPENTDKPQVMTYAARAHYGMGSKGLLISYADNSPWFDENMELVPGGVAFDMSTYFPKFIWVHPPTLDGLLIADDGAVSWQQAGAPDRMRIRHRKADWVELDSTATSYQLTDYRDGDVVEVHAIGIGGEAWLFSNPPEIPPVQTISVPPEWIIYPTERDLSRLHDPISRWSELKLIERYNVPDTWSITAPSEQMGAFSPGSGCVLFRGDKQITSGKMTNLSRSRSFDPKTGSTVDMTIASFTSDLMHLGHRVVVPSPAFQMPVSTLFNFPHAYDVRGGQIETLIIDYIRAQMSDLTVADRRLARLRIPVSLGRGGYTQVSARFDQLGVLVQSLAEAGNLRVRIVRTEDSNGGWLDLVIDEVSDLSNHIRFGSADSTATGIITDWKYEIGIPTTTRAIVVGGGELQERDALQRRVNDLEALWSIAAETLVDQRQVPMLGDRRRDQYAAFLIEAARASVQKSVADDQYLRSWVAGADVQKVAQLGWSWLVGWDQMRLWDLSVERLGEIATEVDATIAENDPLTETVNSIRDAWQATRSLESEVRRALDDALIYAWENNSLGVADGVVRATNFLDQRIASAQGVLSSLTTLKGQYTASSDAHWNARAASTLTELSRGGDEALDEATGPVSVKFTPALGPDLEYRRDVRVGDIVGYDLPGLDPAKDKIREAITTVSVQSGTPTETVTVTVGTPDAPTTRTQQQTARALRGINVVQRST